MGAFYICHSKGTERFYGETVNGRRPEFAKDAEACRRRHGEELEGRRGIDVAAQPGDAGTASTHRRWRDWRYYFAARLSDGGPTRVGILDKVAWQPKRIAVANS